MTSHMFRCVDIIIASILNNIGFETANIYGENIVILFTVGCLSALDINACQFYKDMTIALCTPKRLF